MVVHTHETASDMEVFPGVYFTTDKNKIEWLMRHNDGAIKFFVGYAGWSPGQLEAEIGSSDWILERAVAEDVFAAPGADLWADVLRRKGGPFRLVATMPPDPSLN